MLNNAWNFHETESQQKMRNKSTVYDRMEWYKHLRSGLIVGDGLTYPWDAGRRPIPHAEVDISDPYDSDYSDEYEFE